MAKVYLSLSGDITRETGDVTIRPIKDDDSGAVVAIDLEVKDGFDTAGEGVVEVLLTKDEVEQITDAAYNR